MRVRKCRILAEVSEDIGGAMTGISMDDLAVRFADREGGNMEPSLKKAKSSHDAQQLQGTAFTH